MIPVNIAEASFDAKVRSELSHGNDAERRHVSQTSAPGGASTEGGEWHGIFTERSRRNEQNQTVHKRLAEKSAVQFGARLDKGKKNSPLAESREDSIQIKAAAAGGNLLNFNTRMTERSSSRGIERSRREYQQISLGITDKLRAQWQPQARIEHDAQQGTPARQAAAVGHAGIVGENCADPGYERIRGMADAVNFRE